MSMEHNKGKSINREIRKNFLKALD
jgi:hypothetical protein